VEIRGRRRPKAVAEARLAWYYLLRRDGHSFPGIAKLVDRKCHSTIISGVGRIGRAKGWNRGLRDRIHNAAEMAGIDLEPRRPPTCCPTCGQPNEGTR